MILRVHLPRHGRRRGAALVEFAVVAPVLFFIVFGIIELGRAFMVKELLTEAARRGARAAIVEGATTSQIQSAAQQCLSTIGINGDQVTISVNDAPVGSVNPATAERSDPSCRAPPRPSRGRGPPPRCRPR